MLFDGLLESLAMASGHIQNNVIEEKSKALARAGRIVVGLQGALDLERGGELAQNLNELYAYITRRLFHINAYNDLPALEEVKTLINDISQAWQSLPSLLADTGRKTHYAN
jgi:flagellar protein FliS